jgi:hypothetical protein
MPLSCRAAVAAASLLALACMASPAIAADPSPGQTDENPVVAIVNGEEVHLSTLLELLPEQYREDIENFGSAFYPNLKSARPRKRSRPPIKPMSPPTRRSRKPGPVISS